jgi:hypothetical protein
MHRNTVCHICTARLKGRAHTTIKIRRNGWPWVVQWSQRYVLCLSCSEKVGKFMTTLRMNHDGMAA